jgi:tetratricopeptide (TPR) repeat protein
MLFESQSQTVEHVRDNILKIVDKQGNFYGTGFFIEINGKKYCITCHHCIYMIDEIFVERYSKKYFANWIEDYSNMKSDIAVLNVDNCSLEPLLYATEAMANFNVNIRGFSHEKIKILPEGVSGKKSVLSDSTTDFQFEEEDFNGNNKWNIKPKVYVFVYECSGKFDLGLSGSPVCYDGPNKVVGIFTAKDENFGYVIPIQTILENFEKSRDTLQPFISIDSSGYLEQGNRYFENKEYEKAIKEYDLILNDHNYINALCNKGRALGYMSKPQEAIELYDKVLAIDPKMVRALVGKGSNLVTLNDLTKGKELLSIALEIDPNDLMAISNMGLVLFLENKDEEAIEFYDKALEIDSNCIYALTYKGYYFRDHKNYEEALKYFNKVIEIDEKNFYARSNKGLVLHKLGKYVEALESLDKALEINPFYDWAWSNKGLVLHKLGKYAEAIESLDKALEITPSDREFLNNKERIVNEKNSS